MTYFILLLTGVSIGFVAGLLVFRNNADKAEKAISEIEEVEAKVKGYIKK